MKSLSILVLVLCCLYFVAAGIILIPYAGFQHDEAVFAEPLFQHGLTFYSYPIGHKMVPMMINSYAGAFKTWVYYPIFKWFRPSAYSLRVPVLLIAALSIVLFWPIIKRAGGQRAAVIATVLLATDTMYLLTSTFDWGPVALQHFFLVAVMLAFIRFHETGKPALLALASFLAGVALWEKALFFWLAGALAVACLVVYPKAVIKRISIANLAIALVCFVVGAMPFILYNIHKPNATLGENATVSTNEFDQKLEAAKRTIDAHAIFAYIVFDDWLKPAREPRNGLEKASLALRDATGTDQKNAMLWAYGLSLLLAPLALLPGPGRARVWRPMLFALIFTAVGWALMLITKGAGASVHHVILLWPIPLMFLALAYSEASKRLPRKIALPVLGLVVGVFAAKNVLATNQYLAQFVRDGPTTIWTNAIYPLSADLLQSHYREIDGIDWGTVVPLKVLDRGRLPLEPVTVDDIPQHLGKDDVVFIGHVDGLEVFEGINGKVKAVAAKSGFHKKVLHTYTDENGRPTLELFQFAAN